MIRHLLVATDGSRLSDKAVDAAVSLARDLGARLTVFHATEDCPVGPFPEYAIVYDTLTREDWNAAQDKRARRILDKAAAKARKAGVACKTSFGPALHPYEAIIKAAKAVRCNAIVMASHGRRGIQGLVLGSETNKVLTHSKLPVLVCR